MREMKHCVWCIDDMRAADCKKMAESPEGDFRQAPRQFPGSGKLPFAMLLLWMIPGNAVFSDSDLCLHCQKQSQVNHKKQFVAVSYTIRSISLSRTATLMRYQFKICARLFAAVLGIPGHFFESSM